MTDTLAAVRELLAAIAASTRRPICVTDIEIAAYTGRPLPAIRRELAALWREGKIIVERGVNHPLIKMKENEKSRNLRNGASRPQGGPKSL